MTPAFLLVLFAAADVVRVFRAQIRMEMIAVQIGQIVSQCTAITTPGDMNLFRDNAGRIAGGLLDVSSSDSLIITAISSNSANTANVLRWRLPDATTRGTFGAIAVNGNPIILGRDATRFVVPAGQTLFVTEVHANVEPWTLSAGLIGTVLPRQITGMTMFLSRSSEPARLLTAPQNSPDGKCTA